MCIAQSCTPKKPIAHSQTQNTPIIIDSTFTSQSVNEQVLVSTKFSEKDLKRKDLEAWFRQNAENVNQRNDGILIGNFRKYPNAWFYAQIINTSFVSKQLVVYEFNRIRCDAFEVFTVQNGSITNWGSIDRTIPFYNYPLPFFTYAVPIKISAKDTLNLLIHTQRHYGAHELNLGISTYQTYLSNHNVLFISKVFQIILFIICALIMFILGRIFGNKNMIYLSFYILSLLYMHLSSWGFTDAISNYTSIGLSGKNVGTFGAFISCFLAYPFLSEWMKVVPKNEKIFQIISYSLMGFSLICALCYLLPIQLFNYIYTYIDLPFLMVLDAVMTLVWIFYCSFLSVIRIKIYYLLIGYGVAFIPLIVQQLSAFFSKTTYFLFQANHSTFIFAALGLSIVSIYLLREQLVTRKKLEENISEVKNTMDTIRKNEVATIGRNLHDNVGNILASALGYLNLNNMNKETVQSLVKDAISEIRFLSHNLVKDDNLPIKEKIERLTEHFNEFSNINYVFTDYSNNKINQISVEQQTNLYFIIQELFTNTLKHSFATEVILQIFEDSKRLWITIEDDGVGMTNRDTEDGIGLKNIDTRAKLAGFKVMTDSSTQGTNTTIEIML
jgi:signal transduction histidine kinase